jgi:hypothetical protein
MTLYVYFICLENDFICLFYMSGKWLYMSRIWLCVLCWNDKERSRIWIWKSCWKRQYFLNKYISPQYVCRSAKMDPILSVATTHRRRTQIQTYLQTYHPGRGAPTIKSRLICKSSIGDAALTCLKPDLSPDLCVSRITRDDKIQTYLRIRQFLHVETQTYPHEYTFWGCQNPD